MDGLGTVVRVAAGGKDRLNAMYMVDGYDRFMETESVYISPTLIYPYIVLSGPYIDGAGRLIFIGGQTP